MEKFVEFFKIVGPWASILVGGYILLNLIGELIELRGKIVPEFMKIRKYFKRKRDEKKHQRDFMEKVSTQLEMDIEQHKADKEALLRTEAALTEVKQTLDNFNQHYSADNIAQRDTWMQQVNDAVTVVRDRTASYDLNAEITYKLYRDNARQRIFEFQRWLAAHPDTPATYEEFNQIRTVYDDYHEQLALHNDRNGQIDSTWKAIEADERRRLQTPGLLVGDHVTD